MASPRGQQSRLLAPRSPVETCVSCRNSTDGSIRTCIVWQVSFMVWQVLLRIHSAGWTAWKRIPRHGDGERNTMIDDLPTIESLMERMRAALPMRAHVGRDVLRTLRREAPKAALSHQCDVTENRYAGDEGGRSTTCALAPPGRAGCASRAVDLTAPRHRRRGSGARCPKRVISGNSPGSLLMTGSGQEAG